MGGPNVTGKCKFGPVNRGVPLHLGIPLPACSRCNGTGRQDITAKFDVSHRAGTPDVLIGRNRAGLSASAKRERAGQCHEDNLTVGFRLVVTTRATESGSVQKDFCSELKKRENSSSEFDARRRHATKAVTTGQRRQ